MQIHIRPPFILRPDDPGRRKDAPPKASGIILGMIILLAVVVIVALGLSDLLIHS